MASKHREIQETMIGNPYLKCLAESGVIGILIADLQGHIKEANDYVLRMLGYTREELVSGKISWDKMTLPEYQHLDQQAIEQIRKHGICTPWEKVYVAKDGRKVPMLMGAALLPGSQDTICFVLNLPDRKQSEEKFRWLLESAPDAILITNGRGEIVLVNDQAERLFGYLRGELLGRPVEILIPERFRDRHVQQRHVYYTEPRMRPMGTGLELYVRCKDGREFPVEINLSPLKTEEGILVFSAIRDVTSRKQADEILKKSNEALKKLDKVRSDFIATVSHELRTPLTTLQNAVDILVSGKVGSFNEAQGRFLTMAARNIERLARLVNDVLDLSRLESGRLQHKFSEVDLRGILEDVTATFRPQAEAGSITLVMDCDCSPPTVYADPDRIEQVLYNLVHNALKFTPKRGRVVVSAHGGPETVEVSVTDTGVGIAPEDQKWIFEPFYQGEYSLTQKPMGTGLGLSICKRLIEAHQSRLCVESQVGHGSRFSFNLPIFSPQTIEMTTFMGEIQKYNEHPAFSLLLVEIRPKGPFGKPLSQADVLVRFLEPLAAFIRKILIRDSDQIISQPAFNRLAIVLPNTLKLGAIRVREKLEKAIAQDQSLFKGNEAFIIKILGPATYPQDGQIAKELIAHAQTKGGLYGTEDNSSGG